MQKLTIDCKQNIGIRLIRFGLRFFFLFFEFWLNFSDKISFWILTKLKSVEYNRKGRCQNTGACCQAIGMEVPRWFWRYPKLIHLTQKWHFLRYNFVYLGQNQNMLVYECLFLTKDKLCGIHKTKPKLCRDFPKQTWRGKTRLHKGCGFFYEKNGEDNKQKNFDAILNQKQKDQFQI